MTWEVFPLAPWRLRLSISGESPNGLTNGFSPIRIVPTPRSTSRPKRSALPSGRGFEGVWGMGLPPFSR